MADCSLLLLKRHVPTVVQRDGAVRFEHPGIICFSVANLFGAELSTTASCFRHCAGHPKSLILLDGNRPMALEPDEQYGKSTEAVHGGESHQKAMDSITDPIALASTYTFRDSQSIIDYIEQSQPRDEYGRYGNASESVVERKLASLEGAEEAIIYSSGMAAIVGLIMSKLGTGGEIVFFDECYHRSREFCDRHLARFGVVTRQVEACNYEAMEAAINENTKLLVSESPTNPHLSVVDMERFADLGKRCGVETLIDATLATPFNICPRQYGVDYILHSATKYLGGHNDLLAGVILGDQAKLEEVRYLRGIMGPVNSAHNMYLLQRGLKTFALRMERHNSNGQAIAEYLESHRRVSRVYYPGLPSHKDHEIAASQMAGFGGLVTFELEGADWRATADVVDRCRIPKIAPSLGGVESLIEQPMLMSYYELSPQERQQYGIPDNMIRMSVGIEDGADLIADLDQALQ